MFKREGEFDFAYVYEPGLYKFGLMICIMEYILILVWVTFTLI